MTFTMAYLPFVLFPVFSALSNGSAEDTIGFQFYRVFVYLWILLGLSYLSVVIKYIMRMYLKRADKVKKRVSITIVSCSSSFCYFALRTNYLASGVTVSSH